MKILRWVFPYNLCEGFGFEASKLGTASSLLESHSCVIVEEFIELWHYEFEDWRIRTGMGSHMLDNGLSSSYEAFSELQDFKFIF